MVVYQIISLCFCESERPKPPFSVVLRTSMNILLVNVHGEGFDGGSPRMKRFSWY